MLPITPCLMSNGYKIILMAHYSKAIKVPNIFKLFFKIIQHLVFSFQKFYHPHGSKRRAIGPHTTWPILQNHNQLVNILHTQPTLA